MIKVLFICHGNICRSPMAEIVMQELVTKANLTHHFHIASAATSTEEIGNPVHHGTRTILALHGISTPKRGAVQLNKKDYAKYDYLIGMDYQNIRNMMRIIGSDQEQKIHLLRDFTTESGEIADPWYTGDFELTYKQVYEGCQCLLGRIRHEYQI